MLTIAVFIVAPLEVGNGGVGEGGRAKEMEIHKLTDPKLQQIKASACGIVQCETTY